MINRWDELAENYLDEEFFNRLMRKENSYEYLAQNKSVQFWGDYQEYSPEEKQKIKKFIKSYFSKMTIAQVVTLDDIVPDLDNFQITQKIIGSEHGLSREMFNSELIRYATSELANCLLSKASVEMLSDYKSIMFASEIVINSNDDLQSLDFNMVKEHLSDNKNSKKLVGLGVRGRAELWRVIRPGLLGVKDLNGNQLFDYKVHMGSNSNGLEITESGEFKYRLHKNLKGLHEKSFFGEMFDVPLDQNFEKEMKSEEWKENLENIFEVISLNKKNDVLNLFIDSHFPEHKITEKDLCSKLIGFSNYKNIDTVLEKMNRKIEENFTYNLNGKIQIIKNKKISSLVKKTIENFFTSREAMKDFNYSGLEWSLSGKSPNLKVLNFLKKYDILNFNKGNIFEDFEPKVMSYKNEPEKKYIVVDFAKLWISNVSSDYLMSSMDENKNKVTFIEKMSIFGKILEELGIKNKNEFKYLYVVNIYHEKNNSVIPFSQTEFNDLKKIVKNVVLSVLENKELSVGEMLAAYDSDLMKREIKNKNQNKEKLRKF